MSVSTTEFAFGIGCFHFGIKKTPPFEITAREYVAAVTRTLMLVPGVSNVASRTSGDFEKSSFKSAAPVAAIGQMRGVFPPVREHEIRFDLHVPDEFRLALSRAESRAMEGIGEDFRLNLLPSFQGFPIAFVQPLALGPAADAYDAVTLVKHYLAENWPASRTDLLRFEWLEPTPVPLNVRVAPREGSSDSETRPRFSSEYQTCRGIDGVVVHYAPGAFESTERLADVFLDDAADELGLYYHYTQEDYADARDWSEIMVLVNQLGQSLLTAGFKHSLKRLIQWPSRVDTITSKVAWFQIRRMSTQNALDAIDGVVTGASANPCLFRPLLQRAREKRTRFPTREVSDLTRFVEARREHSLGLLVTIVVGLLAAAIGSLLTIWLAGKGT